MILSSTRSVLLNLLVGVFCLLQFCDFKFRNEPNLILGKSIYSDRCATCHGSEGKGDGIAAPFLTPKPRNFVTGKFKYRTTESGSIPTDDDLERTIREGLHATAMPYWKDFISGDSLHAVVGYIKSFSPRFSQEQPKSVKMSAPAAYSATSIEAGKKVYAKLECSSCHGTDGTGKDAIAGDFKDDWGNELATPNLTEPWTFRGGATPLDIYLRVRTGLDGAPMPSYIGSASEAELWNLANYVVSIGRKPVWSMNEQEIKAHYGSLEARAKADPVAHGKYLIKQRGCEFCHSPHTEDGSIIETMRLAGGTRWSVGPYGYFTTINLTSDKETGLGGWTDEEIKRGITRGIRKDGSRSLPFPMPWTAYSNFTEDDLNALVAYLRTVPAVSNKIPAPEPLNVFSYLWGKFKMLILKEDFPAYFSHGNAGEGKGVQQ